MEKNYYEKKYGSNLDKRKEYGNIELSYNFFIDQNIDKNARILEIGCNIGTLTNRLHELGYKNIIGCDINSDAINYGKKQYTDIAKSMIICEGTELPFKDAEFDIVISFDVIEHIPNVEKHFEEVNRVLKQKGKYIFQTPNKIINIPWTIVNDRAFNTWQVEHCSLQTYSSLKRLVKRHGFDIVRIGKYKLLSDYNLAKIRGKLGSFGVVLIKAFQHFPTIVFPNFWGIVEKK